MKQKITRAAPAGKRWACALLCLVLGLLFPAGALALEESARFYANDAAGVLSDDTEIYICDENYRLYDQCSGAEVVVVAVDFFDGKNAEEYAYELFNDWALGDAGEDNGVLILLSPGEEKYWIMAGDGLTGQLSPGTLESICAQYMESDFDGGDYDEAALNTFKAVVAAVDEKYGVSESDIRAYYSGSTADTYTPQSGKSSGGSGIFALVSLLIVLVIIIAIFTAFRSIGRRRVYGAPVIRPRRTFWGFGPTVRPRRPMPPPPPPRTSAQPRTPTQPRTGGLFGGSSAGRRGTGGGSSRGGGFGGSIGRSSGSSFGGRSSGGSFGSRSSGGRMGGGGGSRGGGAGRR